MLSTRRILPMTVAFLCLFVSWTRAQEPEEHGEGFRPFLQCTTAKGDPGEHAWARLEGCDEADVCPLFRNTSAKLEMQFRVHNSTQGIYRRIYGLFDKVMVPYGREVNICNATASVDDDVKCTQGNRGLRQGHLYQHTGAFFVKPFFPKVKVNVAVYVYDKEGTNKFPIACVLIPVEILDRD
uniref:Putative salivary lipid n=1 Tax=Amblyomma triste TaxID=251400 RepID=A0A023GDH9_AMBTT